MHKLSIAKICNAIFIVFLIFSIAGACITVWNSPPPPGWVQISDSVYEVRDSAALARLDAQCNIIGVDYFNSRYLVVIESVHPLEPYEYER